MKESEIKKYQRLNELAEQNGIVIFGGNSDKELPLCELRQSYNIEQKMYNRSISGLSVKDAISAYDACVSTLDPETVLLHIGMADLDLFSTNSADFDNTYRAFISHIRSKNKGIRIAIISLKNKDGDPLICEMNRHLKYIAESEQCEYGDIEHTKLWNPKNTMSAAAFVASLGFVHPLKYKRPLYDLIKMLYCCEA